MREYRVEIDRRGNYVCRDVRSGVAVCRSREPMSDTDTLWMYRFSAVNSLAAAERSEQLAELARHGVLPTGDLGGDEELWRQ